MNTQVTQAQREQIAQQWRASPQAQGMSPDQVEQYAQQIRSGGADTQIQQHLQTQTQQTPAPNGGLFDIPMPFSNIFPVPMMQPTPFPAMPAMQLIQFPAMPILRPMQPMVTTQPMPWMQPIQFAPLSPPPMMPQMPLVQVPPMSPPTIQDMPQYSSQSYEIPGGSANQQHVNFSGQVGDAQVSYSASSTSGSWSSNGVQAPSFPALPGPFAQPMPIEAPIPAPVAQPEPRQPPPGFVEPLPETPAADPQSAARTPRKRRQREPSITSPLHQPAQGTHAEPQNSRLHGAFAQQLNEETYFSNPPGAPDTATAAQEEHAE